MSAVVLTKRQS